MARNLVGRESVAWVQIPPSPPERTPSERLFGWGSFHSGAEGALRKRTNAPTFSLQKSCCVLHGDKMLGEYEKAVFA